MAAGRAVRWLACAAAVVPAPALAGDKVLIQPAPAWVVPAPAVDPAKLSDASPLILRLDTQERFADGVVWSYRDVATRLASPEVVAQAGNVQLAWQPALGDLIVHRLEILRGGEVIDALAKGRGFTVIRREQRLEQRSLDGMLTATVAVEGLQVGDVLRLAASTTRRDPVLGGAVQNLTLLPTSPAPVGFARTRLLWPASAPVKWRALAGGAAPRTGRTGDTEVVELTGLLPKAADLPGDAPVRFRKLPLMEASSFADWAAVSRAMAPLYAPAPLTGELGAEAARLRAIKDPVGRTGAALQLVQDRVRYLFNGLDGGNYRPQSPAETWTLKYGDCKAKTALLLSLLAAAGIEAEPVLASSQLGDLLPERLPSAAAFDHVLVRATVAGRSYWLDGTGSGIRLADLGDVPPFRWVLPVRAGGASLTALPAAAPGRPSAVATVDIDQSAGLLLPAVARMKLTLRGPAAAQIGLLKTGGDRDQLDAAVDGIATRLVGSDAVVSRYTVAYDAGEAEATVDATATVTTHWQRRDGRWRTSLDRTVSEVTFAPDRSRSAWRDLPVSTGAPANTQVVVRIRVPGDGTGYALQGDQAVAGPLAAATIARTATRTGNLFTVEDRVSDTGAEVAPADVPAMRARVAAAKGRLIRLAAPADLPPRWQTVRDARERGLDKPVLAAYTDAVAAHPDWASRYDNRANFLLGLYDWKAALPDLDKAVALEPTAARHAQRAWVLAQLGQDDKAATDLRAALELEPGNGYALRELGEHLIRRGDRTGALKPVQERIDAGGDDAAEAAGIKAELLARAGDRDGALAAADAALAERPNDPQRLNGRCWLKGQLAVQLDTALKDCTRSIELADSTYAALDSRALVFLRMNRLPEALADLDAALEQSPDAAATLYLRGVVRTRMGRTDLGRGDLDAARLLSPRVADSYDFYGIKP